MPSKASRSNGNGNGRCKVHPHTAIACRRALHLRLERSRRKFAKVEEEIGPPNPPHPLPARQRSCGSEHS